MNIYAVVDQERWEATVYRSYHLSPETAEAARLVVQAEIDEEEKERREWASRTGWDREDEVYRWSGVDVIEVEP